jgi:hypothetical protein
LKDLECIGRMKITASTCPKNREDVSEHFLYAFEKHRIVF